MFQTKVVQKIKAHILHSIIFFLRIVPHLQDNVEKYGTARHSTDDNKTQQRTEMICISDN
jgi:hypothetical protein